MPSERHVTPSKEGGWQIVGDAGGGSEEVITVDRRTVFRRRRDAEAAAKDVVRELGGGQVVLHSPSGRVTEVDTVGPEPQ